MKGRPIVLTLFALFNWVVGAACLYVGLLAAGFAAAADVPQTWDATSGLILAASGLCYIATAVMLHVCTLKGHRPPAAVIATECLTILCVIVASVMIYNSPNPPQKGEGLQVAELLYWFAAAVGPALVQLPYAAWLRSAAAVTPR